MSDLITTTDRDLQMKTAHPTEPRVWATPPVDVYENDAEFLLVADLPGVKREDVKIEYREGNLELEASRAFTGEAATWSSDYRRVFAISDEVDVDRITAEMKNGELYVHLPKQEAKRPRQIPISVG